MLERFFESDDDTSHRASRTAGLVLCLFAAFFALALLSYHGSDPSWSRATSQSTSNAGGTLGAILSDLSLQLLGAASALLALLSATWGWKLLLARDLEFKLLRFSAFLMSIIAGSMLLASFNAPENWPIITGMGGSIGALLYDKMSPLISGWGTALLSMALLAITLPFSLGVSWRDCGRACLFLPRACLSLLGLASYFRADPNRQRWWHRFSRGPEIEIAGEAPPSRTRAVSRITRKLVDTPAEKNRSKTVQSSFELKSKHGKYQMPPLSLLSVSKGKKQTHNEASLTQNARMLESVLQDFGVNGEITKIRPGPVVTLYELEPSPGTRSSRVIGLSDDISRSMSVVSTRIAVIPGRNAIGIELPNAVRETVLLRELFEDDEFRNTEAKLPLALGKEIGGSPIIVDLAKMPHLLVAGTTGSGKSVAINTMIMSLIYYLTPEQCKFIMIDPKMLELSVYDDIPHLLSPVVTEPGKAVVALKWTVKEMENRYRLMSNLGVRNIDGYNKRINEAKAKGESLQRTVQTGFDPETGEPIIEQVPLDMTPLPFIVVVVDEMADLMLVAGKDIESSIQRLAQMARAAGIHIIMATQRPSVDVITGVIKANFPTRISFQVTSRIDSRTILGEQGAEALLGQGDMLYMAGGGRITRVHGPFITDKEVETIVAHVKTQGSPAYIDGITEDEEDLMAMMGGEESGDEDNSLYDQAVAIVCRDKKASTSYIQRCLKIGYNRAAGIIERMEREGVVGPANHVGKREVIGR